MHPPHGMIHAIMRHARPARRCAPNGRHCVPQRHSALANTGHATVEETPGFALCHLGIVPREMIGNGMHPYVAMAMPPLWLPGPGVLLLQSSLCTESGLRSFLVVCTYE
jgi:hypothetical protein